MNKENFMSTSSKVLNMTTRRGLGLCPVDQASEVTSQPLYEAGLMTR